MYVILRSGARLREAIRAVGLTQTAVADRVGISRPRIALLIGETGPRIRVETAAAIEDLLKVPRGELFQNPPGAGVYADAS